MDGPSTLDVIIHIIHSIVTKYGCDLRHDEIKFNDGSIILRIVSNGGYKRIRIWCEIDNYITSVFSTKPPNGTVTSSTLIMYEKVNSMEHYDHCEPNFIDRLDRDIREYIAAKIEGNT